MIAHNDVTSAELTKGLHPGLAEQGGVNRI